MATFIHLLSFVFSISVFLFVSLSLASGLLWLAELIEEHSKLAKMIGMRLIYVVIALHILLFAFDRLPIYRLLFSIACHIVYLTNFTSAWPFISLTSLRFLSSCCLVIADHFVWFFYFAEKSQEGKRYRPGAKYRAGSGSGSRQLQPAPPAFMDVVSFFAFCVWLVPLFLFLSLSANDNVLPSNGPGTPTQRAMDDPLRQPESSGGKTRASLIKRALSPFLNLMPRLGNRRSRAETGIIAPRTPVNGSTPLVSPGFIPPSGYTPWSETEGGFQSPSGAHMHSRAFGDAVSARRTVHMAPPPPRRSVSEYHKTGTRAGLNIDTSLLSPTAGAERSGQASDLASASSVSSTRSFAGTASTGASIRKAVSSSTLNGRSKDD